MNAERQDSFKCNCHLCIEVAVNNDKVPYPFLRLREDETYSSRSIWMVPPECLLTLPNSNLEYPLNEISTWHVDEIQGVQEFLDPELDSQQFQSVHALMPRLTISSDIDTNTPSLVQRLFGHKTAEMEVITSTFGNGRHRTVFAAFAGVEYIPVQMTDESAYLLMNLIAPKTIHRHTA